MEVRAIVAGWIALMSLAGCASGGSTAGNGANPTGLAALADESADFHDTQTGVASTDSKLMANLMERIRIGHPDRPKVFLVDGKTWKLFGFGLTNPHVHKHWRTVMHGTITKVQELYDGSKYTGPDAGQAVADTAVMMQNAGALGAGLTHTLGFIGGPLSAFTRPDYPIYQYTIKGDDGDMYVVQQYYRQVSWGSLFLYKAGDRTRLTWTEGVVQAQG